VFGSGGGGGLTFKGNRENVRIDAEIQTRGLRGDWRCKRVRHGWERDARADDHVGELRVWKENADEGEPAEVGIASSRGVKIVLALLGRVGGKKYINRPRNLLSLRT